jgi:hypothetical protein
LLLLPLLFYRHLKAKPGDDDKTPKTIAQQLYRERVKKLMFKQRERIKNRPNLKDWVCACADEDDDDEESDSEAFDLIPQDCCSGCSVEIQIGDKCWNVKCKFSPLFDQEKAKAEEAAADSPGSSKKNGKKNGAAKKNKDAVANDEEAMDTSVGETAADAEAKGVDGAPRNEEETNLSLCGLISFGLRAPVQDIKPRKRRRPTTTEEEWRSHAQGEVCYRWKTWDFVAADPCDTLEENLKKENDGALGAAWLMDYQNKTVNEKEYEDLVKLAEKKVAESQAKVSSQRALQQQPRQRQNQYHTAPVQHTPYLAPMAQQAMQGYGQPQPFYNQQIVQQHGMAMGFSQQKQQLGYGAVGAGQAMYAPGAMQAQHGGGMYGGQVEQGGAMYRQAMQQQPQHHAMQPYGRPIPAVPPRPSQPQGAMLTPAPWPQ